MSDRRHRGPHGKHRASLRAEFVRLGLRLAFKRGRSQTSVERVRQRLERFGNLVPPPPRDTEVLRLDLDGVPAVQVATPQSRGDHHVLYLHGGAHMSGSPVLYRDFIWRIATATRSRVTILDHRLAPEHPFPAALDDAIIAYRRPAVRRRRSAAHGDCRQILRRRARLVGTAAATRRRNAAAGCGRGDVAVDRSGVDRTVDAGSCQVPIR